MHCILLSPNWGIPRDCFGSTMSYRLREFGMCLWL